ncbi:Acyl-coenzyme A thioesterase PaaI, contains HGG motif [Andreprevotia lacus DSM 23236]|jgi:acyl-coenzyme A thioesterase PaaI-like protein|uniref:Acyl-coenzyme A thioesterase PaaI, contains HGG motif n=1 Tax=Andreprevotia lacus DSM 23236 TaxID=1121001 RepID=A0A1W1XJ04_9NEIS|nr:DUF4442 domain-containing protein [Andreprevotia lacus]SMC23488.1 Acyl-coenzyme A thioesterase PaaI, contains HGG motif [Andreprevotia lacus DSM 23236]
MNAALFRHLVNLWPPFLLTGIHATRITPDYHALDVELRLRWYNRNYVGTHFGGSLFAMTDAWYMLMLMQILGGEYYVWDQSARIDFLAPGRGVVKAQFRLDATAVAHIRDQTENGDKYLPEFTVDIIDAQGSVVARVYKTLYVRRKPRARPVTA